MPSSLLPVGFRRLPALLLLLLVALTVAGTATASAREGADAAFSVRLLASDATGLSLAVRFPAYDVADGRVTMPGVADRLQTPGAPPLPFYTTFVALPPGATVRAEVTTGPTQTAAVGALPPVAAELDTAAWAALNGETATVAVPAAPAGLYPAVRYELSAPAILRDLRVARLALYPLRYDAAAGVLDATLEYNVNLIFSGAAETTAIAPEDGPADALAADIINFAQAATWRVSPETPAALAATVPLPLNKDVFKIAIRKDGIYEVTYADLVTAGMNVAAVNPATFQMMHRGEPVAFTFIGDADAQFEPGEKLRFYGFAFTGPRADKMFIVDNIFWLWAGGTPTAIQTVANGTGLGYPAVTSFPSSVTAEPENYFFTTWTDQWPTFQDEPDSWYWDAIQQTAATPNLTKDYAVTLPYPLAGGPAATITTEFMSRESSTVSPGFTYSVRGSVLGNAPFGTTSWQLNKDVRVAGTVPASQLQNGSNTIHFEFLTNVNISATPARMYLNRITVDYQRELRATSNELFFNQPTVGQHEFQVAGFSTGDPAAMLVYDITNPRLPAQIPVAAGDIVNNGGVYTVKVGSNHGAGAQYLTTTTANILSLDMETVVTPKVDMTKYVGTSLTPASGGAKWLAIAHNSLLASANTMATFRSTFSGLSTHVVDIQDVINQYGYGLPLPSAINAYLTTALATWTPTPGYLLLVGDATINPKNLDCPLLSVSEPVGCSLWNKDEPNLVLTNLPFVDRFNGLIPSDFPYSLLVGNDLLPDIAIGRIPAANLTEANNVVNKIMAFETQRANTPQAWHNRILFVADNTDAGGNFCAENVTAGQAIPPAYTEIHLCLPNTSVAAKTQLRTDMNTELVTGVSILNYRGHGAVTNWANDSGLGAILTSGDLAFWQNQDKPIVIVSADCLDGFFGWPNQQGLGETFLKMLAGKGTAAHWSSSGLGFSSEHTVLHTQFYNARFVANKDRIGDAANYAKEQYFLAGEHPAELYGFNLLGDPAMKIFAVSGPTAVGLRDFTITPAADGLRLTWHTATELGTAGFRVARTDAAGRTVFLPAGGIIPARGGSTGGAHYTLVDTSGGHDRGAVYRLYEVTVDGRFAELAAGQATGALWFKGR